jgi:hypothetical protein
MTHIPPSQGLNQLELIARACDFLEHPAIREAAEKAVPCTMPQTVGGLGFDVPLWMGLGVVGLWSALDAYSERAGLGTPSCGVCKSRCLVPRFTATGKLNPSLSNVLAEIEDLRNLFAHNFAGLPDATYFKRPRHVLKYGTDVTLSSGAQFAGGRVSLQVDHLRCYALRGREILEALSSLFSGPLLT